MRRNRSRGDTSNADSIRVGIVGLGSWFTTRELSGGGALVDIGVHALDFALYLLDSRR